MSEIDSTQLLPMAVVLGDGALEPSKEILYADYIDKSKVVSAFNSLVELGSEGGICQTTSQLIADNDGLMSKTGSGKFYNDELAKTQFGNMNVIGFKFDQIKEYVNNTNELTTIETGINNYNEKLTKLKTNCRKKLLQNYADEFNKAKHEWDGFPKTKTYTYTSNDYSPVTCPEQDEQFDYCYGDDSVEYEVKYIRDSCKEIELKDDTGYVYSSYYKYSATYEVHKYKYIKHWNFFKNWDTWFDPDVGDIEKLYKKVGAELPYDSSLIIGPDAE